MRTYYTGHNTEEGLSRELLFKEVMRLRNIVVTAESMLSDISDMISEERNTSLNRYNEKIKNFLNERI